eukprot:TRINITY_DN101467_c0_g1_i1.p1 TRINITY_DN101467_c0_g1~~TRINITY_DN101467_c0_g1_i1.p1  ORF type:complete len:645 (-),score=107.89 TRINITY_DN101467_c0_g1_i1:21-1955(-)
MAPAPRCDARLQRIHVDELNAEDFEASLRRKAPLIIEGVTERWRARTWTAGTFLQEYGDLEVAVRGQLLSGGDELSQGQVTVRDYLTSDEHNATIQIGFNEFDTYRQLRHAISPMPGALRNVMEEPVVSVGRRATGSSFHKHAETWLVQLFGRKGWLLAPPSAKDLPLTELPCSVWGRLGGAAKESTIMPCEVAPGTAVFLPSQWYHATCNLEESSLGIGGRGDSSSWPPWFHAIAEGDVGGLESSLRDNQPPKAQLKRALHLASIAGPVGAAELLLNSGADLEALDRSGAKPVHLAAEHGQTEVLQLLAARGAKLQATDGNGFQALHWSARVGHASMTEWLVGQRSDVAAVANDGTQPLHRAARKGHLQVVDLLLRLRADATAAAKDGTSPLHWAGNGVGQADVARALLGARAQVSAKAKNGATPLHQAAQHGHNAFVKELLAARADALIAMRDGGAQPLHLSTMAGYAAVAETLLAGQAPLHAKCARGLQPAHWAALKGRAEVMAVLLEHGASPDAAIDGGLTPLHLAASSGHVAVAERLTGAGADVKAAEGGGMTALQLAEQKGHAAVVAHLAPLSDASTGWLPLVAVALAVILWTLRRFSACSAKAPEGGQKDEHAAAVEKKEVAARQRRGKPSEKQEEE